MLKFKRGQVFEGNIPESIHTQITPKPGFFLHGKHKLVVLHDHDTQFIDPRIVMVVPITSAKAEVAKAQKERRDIYPSYVPIGKDDHSFLDNDSYLSTVQIMPINRQWLHSDSIGTVEEAKLWEMSFHMVVNLGLGQVVQDLAYQQMQEKYGHLVSLDEVAAADEGNK